ASATASAFANLSNQGALAISANAAATGLGNAQAVAVDEIGVEQEAIATGTADASLVNDGTMTLAANATANAGFMTVGGPPAAVPGTAVAEAIVDQGVFQVAIGGKSAIAAVSNTGTFNISANAHASAIGNAEAVGAVVGGIIQDAESGGPASASIINSGTLAVAANATATATGNAV